MSNSDTLFKVAVKLNKPMIGAKLTIISPAFKKIESTLLDSLVVQVPAGIYQVRIDAPGFYQEEYIQVISDGSFVVTIKSISAFPVNPYSSTNETHQIQAHQFSEKCTHENQSGKRPNFFFFIAFYSIENIAGNVLPVDQFALFNDVVNVKLNAHNTFQDASTGMAVFSADIPTGLYFLSYNPVKGESRIIPIYIIDGKQTQFFIRCTEEPDFSNCRIFFSDRMEFDFKDPVYYTMERLLMAFSNFEFYKTLTETEHLRIGESPYLMTLANILHLALHKEIPYSKKTVLHLPDLEYLLLKSEGNIRHGDLADRIPILAFVMYECSGNDEGITAASLMDRVAEYLKYDLFWSSFTHVDTREEVAVKIHRGIRQSTAFGKVRLFFENLPFVQSKVSVDEIRKEVSENQNVRGDETEIAKKLNIPLTTVIRNYESFKKVYTATVKREFEMKNERFVKGPGSE